jgi:hypothetical protein
MDPSIAVTSYYASLIKQIQTAYGNLINGKSYPVEAGGQGDFPYYYLNSGSNPPAFTLQTFNFISAQVYPSPDVEGSLAIQSGGSFNAAYLALINQINFQLSNADQQALTNAQNSAVGTANNLVQQFQTTIGPITQAQIAAATAALPDVPFTGAQGNINYIMNYVLGLLWSGATPPLTWQEMQNSQNLQALLPKMPAAGPQILPSVTAYLNAVAAAIPYNDQLQQGSWTIAQIKSNLQTANLSYPKKNPTGPGPAGMYVVDPTGQQAPTYSPSYAITRNSLQIVNDLGSSNSVSVTIKVTEQSAGQFSMSINGGASFSFGGPFLTFSGGTSGSIDLVTTNGAGTSCAITLTYTGFSNVPIAPMAWSGAQWGTNPNFTAGWYYPAVIQEAYQNFQLGSSATTGFNFASEPSISLDSFPAGLFNDLTNVLISNYPTISVQYTQGNYSTFSQQIATNSSGTVKLFGFIPIGSASMSTYSSKVTSTSSQSTFSVNFTAPSTKNVPTYQQTAYVVGAVVNSPGAVQSVVNQLMAATRI